MVRIYFARHGESQANIAREISNRGLRHGLTTRGREQAAALAERLDGLPITRLYCSPLLRAIETTVLVAHRLKVDYEVADALREFDCGIYEGRSDEAAWQGNQELTDAWLLHGRHDYHAETGECFNDLRSRFVPFVEGLIARHADEGATVVCIAHGGLYRMMLPLVVQDFEHSPAGRQGFDYASYLVTEGDSSGLYWTDGVSA